MILSLVERLPYAEDPNDATQPAASAVADENGAQEPVIFLVHGRNHGLRAEVAGFLERAGDHKQEVVILDEQASRGKTLVEKLESHAFSTQYAVILLTGDDEGGLKGSGDLKARARQNVVFELGWFFAALNRENVAVLCEPDVERPSDIEGLVYISTADDWERLLVRELVHAGLDFDTRRA